MPKIAKHKTDEIANAMSILSNEGTEIPERLMRYVKWGDKYLSGKKRPTKKMVDKILLDFARDFNIWLLQLSLEKGDFEALARIASEVLDRYESRPKAETDATEEARTIGNIILPPQKQVEIQNVEGNYMAASPGSTDGVSE